MIKGNKGEWSELYVFTKLLDERNLLPADENLVINREVSYPVLKIFRDEPKLGKLTYDLEGPPGLVRIIDPFGSELAIVNLNDLKIHTQRILEEISTGKNKRAFSIPELDGFLRSLFISKIKAPSEDKSDILLAIKDGARTELDMGYSIKSMAGAPSTLLNSSGATNFVYEISNLDSTCVETVNGTKKFKEKLKLIYDSGGSIKFDHVASDVFKQNLELVDNTFPQVLAQLLLNYYEGKGRTFAKLLEDFDQSSVGLSVTQNNHRYKVRNFLINVALGMVPDSEWNGYTKSNGGYIIVKRNGEVCCYQLYFRDKFQDYLYSNTQFDTPSTTKFKFGKIYTENGRNYIKLNLQIRYKK